MCLVIFIDLILDHIWSNIKQWRSTIKINFKNAFAQFVKKSRKPLQLTIEDKVGIICQNPRLGQQKLGDLQGVFVYKFYFNQQEYLMAYQFEYEIKELTVSWIDFYLIGSHENFYTQLKKIIRFV